DPSNPSLPGAHSSSALLTWPLLPAQGQNESLSPFTVVSHSRAGTAPPSLPVLHQKIQEVSLVRPHALHGLRRSLVGQPGARGRRLLAQVRVELGALGARRPVDVHAVMPDGGDHCQRRVREKKYLRIPETGRKRLRTPTHRAGVRSSCSTGLSPP